MTADALCPPPEPDDLITELARILAAGLVRLFARRESPCPSGEPERSCAERVDRKRNRKEAR